MAQFTKNDVVLVKGLDEAFIGVAKSPIDGSPVAIYSITSAIEIISEREGIGYSEAQEQILGRVMGFTLYKYPTKAPIWVEEISVDELRAQVLDAETLH
jgi:hypothetical protein